MPVIEEVVRTRLVGSTALKAQVGNRVYSLVLPQDPKLPAVTFGVISADREHASSADPGTVHSRIQTTAWGATLASASAAKEGVRSALQRWRSTSADLVVHDVFADNELSFFEEDTSTYANVLDWIVHYEE